MAFTTGKKSRLYLRKEAAWGTDPAGTYYDVGFVNESVHAEPEYIRSNTIANSVARAALYQGSKKTVGQIGFEAWYTNMDFYLGALFGDPAQSTVDTVGRSKIYTPTTSPYSLHMKFNRGNIPSAKVYRYPGQYGVALELSWTGSGIPTGTFEVTGPSEASASGGDTEPSSPTVVSTTPILTHLHGLNIDVGAGANNVYCVRSGKIRLQRSWNADIFCVGTSGTARQPVENDFMSVTGELEIMYEDRVLYELFLAGTDQTDIRIDFQGDLIPGGTTVKYECDIRVNRAKYLAPSVPQISGPAEVTFRAPFEAFGNAGSGNTTEPATVTYVNAYDKSTF